MIVAMLILAALQALVDLVHHHSNGFKHCTTQVHWKKQEKKMGKNETKQSKTNISYGKEIAYIKKWHSN